MDAFMSCLCGDQGGQTVEAVDSLASKTRPPPREVQEAVAIPAAEKPVEAPASGTSTEFQVKVSKNGVDPNKSRIGLDISAVGGKVLKVWKVKEGLIAEWNKSQPEDQQVKPSDAVVEVNGKGRGHSDILLDEVSKSVEITLTFSRGLFEPKAE
eukprot:gb/GFBE01022935.1/.p1 GENE.gb/GFBE01022935.1/~~gb/GFBE01022935.1/.p1  ORF type:complete len:154 (+),score=35.69 gb/GFBE01022935.1/:1-462(+)